MKITLLGATGFVGHTLLQRALEQNHEVTTLVRTPVKLGQLQRQVNVVHGNYFDPKAVTQAIDKADVVMSTIGPPESRRSQMNVSQFQTAMQQVVQAVERTPNQRFIHLASTGTRFGDEALSLGRKALRLSLSLVAPLVIPCKEAELEVLRQSDICWTSIRPPLIKDTVNGYLCVSHTQTQGWQVDVTQLADFMLESIDDSAFYRSAPFVGTRNSQLKASTLR